MTSKKKQANIQQKIKANQYKQKEQAQAHKKKMLPFVRFLKKHDLKFNHARVGNSRIQYFRLDDFQKIVVQKQTVIEQDEQLNKVSKQIQEEIIFFKRPSHVNAKYPNILQPILSTAPQKQKKFASFRFDTTQSKKTMMIGLIIAILSLVLFPVWPFQLKYAIWLISLVLLIFLVGLLVVRLVIYLVCVIFGYDVWIFPNLMGEKGFFDSFKPVYYYQKWESSWFNLLIRVFVLSSIAAYGCYMVLNPDVFHENIQMTKQTVNDIHDWGVSKIKNQKNFSQSAITNLEDILNETQTEHIHDQGSQYTSFSNQEPRTDENDDSLNAQENSQSELPQEQKQL